MLTVQQLPLSGWPSRDGGGFFSRGCGYTALESPV